MDITNEQLDMMSYEKTIQWSIFISRGVPDANR